MTDLNVFTSSIKFLQGLHSAFPYQHYEKAYHALFKKFFIPSSVSICFRLAFKKEVIQKLNEKDKQDITNKILSYVNNNNNFVKSSNIHHNSLDINTLIPFMTDNLFPYSTNLMDFSSSFSIELLLVKRAASHHDRYSGNVAFPGGKFEKEDVDDFTTAVRETKEEIGLQLCEDSPIISRYLGHNTRFDVTLDFRYLVTSHLFLIFDLFRESESLFTISDKELSDIFFVPLDYLLQIDSTNQEDYHKSVLQKTMGEEAFIDKLILNKNENFLVYGLTLRKIIHLLNISGENHFKYTENVKFKGRLKRIGFYTLYNLLKFFTNPLNSYNVIKSALLPIFGYYSVININHYFIRSKF